MDKSRAEVEVIFAEALERTSPEEQAAYLDEACRNDAELRSLVRELLEAHGNAGDFLEAPPDDLAATLNLSEETEEVGTVIGRYKLLQKIGEGAFGTVFMAEQSEPVLRKVALKIIKPGMDTREVIARFEAERQALALMDHQNIAQVFDAGETERGRPYFVMELVRGVPITAYCDRHCLTAQQRLELFVTVCHTVQHAHQKGIIHRDLKPSNILVTLHDIEPVVKLIDFGVAKAINQRLTKKTFFTRFHQIIGTPMYMSPEQAEMSGLDVDTRTDVYSLGVLLYEMLTGATPLDKKQLYEVPYDELRRIIREEEAAKPSTKISALGDTAVAICAHRKTEPKRLSALLRGDLDWIVMKALEKDRRRRYETAKDFAADITRYLNHQPVEASPPSTIYWLRKMIRRNRTAVAVLSLASLLLVLVAVGLWRATVYELQTKLAERNRTEEMKKRNEAEQKTKNLEWLRKAAIPNIEKLKGEKKWTEAFALAEKARGLFPEDPEVRKLWFDVSSTWTVATTPPAAKVSLRLYGDGDRQPVFQETCPVNRAVVPREFYRWNIEAEGYEPMEGCAGPGNVDLKLNLFVKGKVPEGMVAVAASFKELNDDMFAPLRQQCSEFFLDRFEVVNSQYKRFVDAGGYRDPQYWQGQTFFDGEKQLSWDEAVKRFVDRTGKPGPSTWTDGTYPSGEDRYPVRGVSWHEAAAYARFANKSLPTVKDWQLASGREYGGYITHASNFGSAAPLPVGLKPSVGPFGTYDMAGNVREWCWNEGSGHWRYILGGAWNEVDYMFRNTVSQPPLDRSEKNGFRCALYTNPPSPEVLAPVIAKFRDASREQPVSDQVFEVIARMYAYEPKPSANATSTLVEECNAYRHELITFDALYNNETMAAHLYLPKHVQPPYQAIIYFPGSCAGMERKWTEDHWDVVWARALMSTGRAVLFPVYKKTFERGGGNSGKLQDDTQQDVIQQALDFRESVDYLCSRHDDIRPDTLAYVGESAGSVKGPIMLALEHRVKAAVFLDGGVYMFKLPVEIDGFNFAPRVTIPILMLNGRYDNVLPLATSQIPLFNAMGTPEKDKCHRLIDVGHCVPLKDAINHTKEWLDRYLGTTTLRGIEGGPDEQIVETSRAEDFGSLLLSWEDYATAESYFKKALDSRRKIQGNAHRETLRTTRRLAAAVAGQGRNDEALDLLENALKIQQKELDPDNPEVREVISSRCELWRKSILEICGTDNRPQKDYDRAAEFARRLTKASPAESPSWIAAYAFYRQGDSKAGVEAIQESLASGKEELPEQWFLAALLFHKMGNEEQSRDWFAAASQRINPTDSLSPALKSLRQEAASLLSLPEQWPPVDWSAKNYLEVFDRLIAKYPKVAWLHEWRGSLQGSLSQWDAALADYQKSIELDPNRWSCREAFAAITLWSMNKEDSSILCRGLIDKFKDHKNASLRMDMVVICSLSARADVDRQFLDTLAEKAYSSTKKNAQMQLGKGMAAYRCGRYEDALQVLPEAGFSNSKEELLSSIFRAMARHHLGDIYTARKLLEKARQEIQKQIPTPEGPSLFRNLRPAAWCMIQTALREAEVLMPPESR